MINYVLKNCKKVDGFLAPCGYSIYEDGEKVFLFYKKDFLKIFKFSGKEVFNRIEREINRHVKRRSTLKS